MDVVYAVGPLHLRFVFYMVFHDYIKYMEFLTNPKKGTRNDSEEHENVG